LLIFAGAGEVATGLALLIVPSLVGQLLLGEVLTDIAIPVARVAGIALVALGIACWTALSADRNKAIKAKSWVIEGLPNQPQKDTRMVRGRLGGRPFSFWIVRGLWWLLPKADI
jgi:hypothetical protein